MQIGQRLRGLRIAKNLSQGDVEHRTGITRFYTSRVEHGRVVPSLETLEKYARAFGIPTYQLFVANEDERSRILLAIRSTAKAKLFGNTSKEERYLVEICHLLGKMSHRKRSLVLSVAAAMARRKKQKSA